MSGLEHTKVTIHSQAFPSLVSTSYHKTGFSLQIFQQGLQMTNELDRTFFRRPCDWTRGDVDEFSHESRKRLLKKFACLQTFDLHNAKFLTLTYHHGYQAGPLRAREDLSTFLQYLRDTHPGIRYIWRLELQKRGAPHFHLIVFFPYTQSLEDVNSFDQTVMHAWHRIADPTSGAHAKYGCKVENVSSRRKCFSYLSKYIAKEDQTSKSAYKGRRWGHSRNMNFKPLEDIDVSHGVWVILRRMVRKLLKARGKVSVDFQLYLKTDKSAFVYIPATTILDMVYIAQKAVKKKTLEVSERQFLNQYANRITTCSRKLNPKTFAR